MNSIETVFEWLLAATLRASVLAIVILCIQLVLRRWLPASWRHALWLPMLAVLVLPALFEAPFALLPQTTDSHSSAPAVARKAVYTEKFTGVTSPVVTDAPKNSDAIALPTTAEEVTLRVDATPTVAPPFTTKLRIFAIVWLIGACGILSMGFIGYLRNIRSIRINATEPDRALLASITEAACEAGLKRAPHAMISSNVASPAVTGFTRPILLLPRGFPEDFSAPEARLILLHEFTHLKRYDLPLNWLMCLLQAMHWFNPLLWFAFARMRADREMACDARVLSIDATDRRAEYGGALLKLQCIAPSRALSLGFVGIFERVSEIKSRIREISAYRRSRHGHHIAGGAIVTLLILVGVTKGQQTTPSGSADTAPDKSSSAARESAQLLEQANQAGGVDAASKGRAALPAAAEEKHEDPGLQALENQLLGNWSWKSDCGWTGGYTFKENGVMEGLVKWAMSDNGETLNILRDREGRGDRYKLPVQDGKLVGKSSEGNTITLTKSDLPTFEFQLLGTWGCKTDDQWTGIYTFKENGAMAGDYSWDRDKNILVVTRPKDGKLDKYELPIKDGILVGKSAEGKRLVLTKTQSVTQAHDYQILGTWNGESDKGWKDVRTFKEDGAMEGGVKWLIVENKSFVVIRKNRGPGSYEEYPFPLQYGKLIGKNDLGETVTLTR